MGCFKILFLISIIIAIFFGVSYQPFSKVPAGQTMTALLTTAKGTIEYVEVPIPVPQRGQLLVKVLYAPVNPSDVYRAIKSWFYAGGEPEFPYSNGLEATGIAVGSGGGVLPYIYAQGGFLGVVGSVGTWAEYVVVDAMAFLPVDKPLGPTIVNPVTVMSMLEIAKEGGHKTIVHTAASSELGKMLLRACGHYNVTILCVVRGEKNEKILTEEFNHPKELVIRSDDEKFEENLKKAIEETGATLAFDAVSGDLSRKIYNAMPDVSVTYVYGGLGGELPEDLVQSGSKSFNSFLVSSWLDTLSVFERLRVMSSMRSMLNNELHTEFVTTLTFKDPSSIEVIKAYADHQKSGKIVLKL